MTTIRIVQLENDHSIRNFIEGHMQQHPFIFSDERKYRIRRHIAFWGIWWLFQSILYSFVATIGPIPYRLQLPNSAAESFIYLAPHMFMSYSLMYFVVPRFLLKQKYWHTAFWVMVVFLLTSVISSVLSVTVVKQARYCIIGNERIYGPVRPMAYNVFLSLMAGLRGGITIGGLAASIKLMKYWYVKEQRNLQLQKENVESQLQLLKAQVHPHFLFNTLNNIYSHTQKTAPVASKLVAGLSDMLRFILYEGTQSMVPLSKELKMINDYIGLEKIRYGNKLDLHIDVPEQTDHLHIAPLLLLPLVENSFKHGASNILEQPWISLKITLQDNHMQMKLLNGKAEEVQKDPTASGIGIENVKKRLELLYPYKHELTITNEQDVFIVNLKIELKINPEAIKEPGHVIKLQKSAEPSHV